MQIAREWISIFHYEARANEGKAFDLIWLFCLEFCYHVGLDNMAQKQNYVTTTRIIWGNFINVLEYFLGKNLMKTKIFENFINFYFNFVRYVSIVETKFTFNYVWPFNGKRLI